MINRKYLSLACIAIFTFVVQIHSVFAENEYVRLPDDIRKNTLVQNLMAQSSNKVQVLEFFSYGCAACAKFEPAFEKWNSSKTQKNVSVTRLPVTFNQEDWQGLANLYYIMRTLDPNEDLNEQIFTAVHQQGERLWEESAMRQFFMQNGYNETQFNAAYAKYGNNDAAKKADALSNAYGINATPAVIVNGPKASYLLTIDQNSDNYFKVLNQVITIAAK